MMKHQPEQRQKLRVAWVPQWRGWPEVELWSETSSLHHLPAVFSDEWLPLGYHVWALKIRWRWKWFWPISSFPPENFLLLQMMPLVHIWVAAPEEQLDRVTSGPRVERRALLKQANIQLRWRGSLAKIDWTSQRWARQPSSQTSKHSAQAGDLFTKYSSLEASFFHFVSRKICKDQLHTKPHKATIKGIFSYDSSKLQG